MTRDRDDDFVAVYLLFELLKMGKRQICVVSDGGGCITQTVSVELVPKSIVRPSRQQLDVLNGVVTAIKFF